MSDGTDVITRFNSKTFEPVKIINVSENGKAVTYLNELEYVDEYIFANVYTTNTIVKINAESGNVVGRLDLWNIDKIAMDENPKALEMNGVAYDSTPKKIINYRKNVAEIF